MFRAETAFGEADGGVIGEALGVDPEDKGGVREAVEGGERGVGAGEAEAFGG